MLIVADALERIGPAIGLTGENASASEVAIAAIGGGLEVIVSFVEAIGIMVALFASWVEWNSKIRDQLIEIKDLIPDLSGVFGGSIFDEGAYGTGTPLGFAGGGTFTVGGAGGPDSQLVSFRANPGEQVTISQPGQSNIPGIDTGRVSGAVLTAAQRIAGQMLKQFENDLVKELSR